MFVCGLLVYRPAKWACSTTQQKERAKLMPALPCAVSLCVMQTALIVAASEGQTDTAVRLVELKANIEAKDNEGNVSSFCHI